MKAPAEKMMALAVSEARKGWGRTSPNPMVGAVVAVGDRVIAKGWHPRAGGPHAEVVALGRAGDQARGADLYVTLEPCHHQGRTPPCTRAIVEAGIRKVIIGVRDPNPKVQGGGAGFLADQGLTVEVGILEKECRSLIEFFEKFITTGRPFVLLKTAATLDGKTATFTGHSKWITSEKARAFVHRLRDGMDAILVGRGTADLDNPLLSTRLNSKSRKGRHPLRVVLDTQLRLPLERRVLDPATGGPTVVVCGPEAPEKRRSSLLDQGVDVWSLPLRDGRIALGSLLDRLGEKGVVSLLIEGGAEVNFRALVDEKIVDKVLFFYAPKIVGGRSAPSLVGGPGLEHMDQAMNLDITAVRRLGPDLLVEAIPLDPAPV